MTQQQVEILGFGMFYNEGDRGMQGGLPQNDKVWGIARVNGMVYSFWGRRDASFRSKRLSAYEAMDKLGQKLDKGYTSVANKDMQLQLVPDLHAKILAAI